MTVSYPQKVLINLQIQLEIPNSEAASYIFANPETSSETGELQIGMIADLFDIFSYHSDLEVLKINGTTHAEIQKKLSATL
jgi:hypothetical protein